MAAADAAALPWWGAVARAVDAVGLVEGGGPSVSRLVRVAAGLLWLRLVAFTHAADTAAVRVIGRGLPVVKGGGAGAYWSSGGALGMTSSDGVVGEGLSFGYHFAVGGALSLGFIERGSTARLREGFGVDHTYVFGEWMLTDLGSFAPNQMRVGSSSWVVGLALEL